MSLGDFITLKTIFFSLAKCCIKLELRLKPFYISYLKNLRA